MRVVNRSRTAAAVPTPAKWRVIGELRNETELPGLLEWRDDTGLTGSTEAIKAVDEYVATGQPVDVTPTGPFLKTDRHDELSAYVLALNLLGHTADVVGTPPALPSTAVPDGADA